MDGSKQGDSVVKYIFSLLGVKTEFEESEVQKVKSENRNAPTTVTLKAHRCLLPRLDYDFTGSPDLAQTFVVCCCLMGVKFKFTGLASLKIKETDRIEALKKELKKVGYVIKDENDDTYEDHRMAMAFAPIAFKLPQLKINHPEVVSKSYPHFWEDLKKAGFEISEE